MTQKKDDAAGEALPEVPQPQVLRRRAGAVCLREGDCCRVKRGSDVEVTCDRTGRDLTLEVLARILYEEVRARGLAARYYDRGGKATFPVTVADVSRLIRSFAG